MPRKKILGPATTSQVVEYFQTRELAVVEEVLNLVTAEVSKRKPVAQGKPVNARKPRVGKSTPPAQYGESLSDA
jgi:hypothetical protein